MVDSFLGYDEIVATFSFRETAALTIPKSVRERAYSLAVDIEIVSVAKELYLNYSSNPAYGFYGYVTLVMQDHSEIAIALSQPRQRVYYKRIDEAFTNWYGLYLHYLTSFQLNHIEYDVLLPIGAALKLVPVPIQSTCPTQPSWIEVPLRELYVKSHYGCQFKIEVTHYEPVPAIYGECSYDGKSGQIDGDKDDGLPPKTQPNKAKDPLIPYVGLPPVNSFESLGEFANFKGSELDNTNPDNQALDVEDRPATATSEGYYISWNFSYVDFGTCTRVSATRSIGCTATSTLSAGSVLDRTEICGGIPVESRRWTVTNTAEAYTAYNFLGYVGIASISYGFLPPDYANFRTDPL